MDQRPDDEADHVEATVLRMADLHSAHEREATPLQRQVTRLTSAIGRPSVLAAALVIVLVWVTFNLLAPALRLRVFDPPPFNLLELVATVIALFTTLMILTTQRREEEAARHRSQLTLQLASLSEQKVAKVIALLEEQRRENPALRDRADREADEMAQAADPGHVLERIKSTHEASRPG